MNSQLARFPSFTVQALERGRGLGEFDRPPSYPKGWVYVHLGGSRFLELHFEKIGGAGERSVFRVGEGDPVGFSVGQSYRWLDSYWGPLAELVLDRGRGWEHVRFAPRAAVRVVDDRGTWMRRADADDEGDVVEDQWDHEHCEICHAKIALFAQPTGWRSSFQEWICEKCYETHVSRDSLDFIPTPD